MRNNSEYQNNLSAKKMIVTERDPANMRVRAKIMDEDGVETYWLDILSKSSSSNKSFEMPDEGDEVWAHIDPKGEEGYVAGSRYNKKDVPPGNDNAQVVDEGPWGRIELNKSTGNYSLNVNGIVRISATQIILEGDVDLGGEGGPLIHRKGDVDTAGDIAIGSASKVRAI